ncbi:MAG TPA: PA14 domain-containing protein [Candidatus Sulfomarinibacteraceae bacterium]|nr:PA14 domain-containing protein [Candidatus Sulfomarinibacteraceae bacterium]
MKIEKRFIGFLAAILLLLAGGSAALAQSETPTEAQWYARYWNNTTMIGPPVLERNETAIDYDWGFDAPDPAVNRDGWSARWTSFVTFEAGTYQFTVTSDDGVRLWVSNDYVINSWEERTATTDTAIVTLSEGTHAIALDYFDARGLAQVSLDWQRVERSEEGTVAISPRRGPAGTALEVNAGGFTPGATASVGLGVANSEPAVSVEAPVDANGRVETTITMPDFAEPGEQWRVVVLDPVTRALSESFVVTEGDDAPENVCGDTYLIQPGDWLASIARRCNTSVEAILALNSFITDPDIVEPGQTLQLPPAGEAAAEPAVSITPDNGLPGTEIQVNAAGFPPNVVADVGIGRANSETTANVTATTDANGLLETTILLPDGAQPGEPWVVLVRAGGERALSEPFAVTEELVTATPQYNLNVRTGPGTNFQRIGRAPAGDTAIVLGRNERGDWVRIRLDNQEGWIAAWLADIDGSLENVPVLSQQ